jgi:hypothetical protein
MKNLTRLALIVLCAALCFGGSFTCKGSTNGRRFTGPPTTPP